MNKPNEAKQCYAELIESFGVALGLVTAAISRGGNADQIHAALQSQIAAAKTRGLVPPLAIHLATYALVAVEGDRMAEQIQDPPHQH